MGLNITDLAWVTIGCTLWEGDEEVVASKVVVGVVTSRLDKATKLGIGEDKDWVITGISGVLSSVAKTTLNMVKGKGVEESIGEFELCCRKILALVEKGEAFSLKTMCLKM